MSRNYVTVDVDVYLDEFDDDTLIEELEGRGYTVIDEEHDDANLTDEEKDVILKMLVVHDVGTIEYDIYEKLRKR